MDIDMRIGGIGNIYPTYVYNPNTVSARSMDKLSRISDDVLDKKVDYSETEAQENQNPLRKGQTINFEGILAKQMQQGQNRAARIMVKEETLDDAGKVRNGESGGAAGEDAALKGLGEAPLKTEKADWAAAAGVSSGSAGNTASFMQMQRAIEAYGMFMTA